MFSLVQGFKMHLNLVWFRLRVSKSQRHTPTQKHSEHPYPGQSGFSEHKAGDFQMTRHDFHSGASSSRFTLLSFYILSHHIISVSTFDTGVRSIRYDLNWWEILHQCHVDECRGLRGHRNKLPPGCVMSYRDHGNNPLYRNETPVPV